MLPPDRESGDGCPSAGQASPQAMLAAAAGELGLVLDAHAIARLLAYLRLLQHWNGTYNLTALRDPAQMFSHHLLDCLAALPALQRHVQNAAARVLDVGSGGGLPGAVIAMLMPQLQVACVDTVGKKAAFIRQVAGELGLRNLTALHARVEKLSGSYDVITSRAFASLSDFCRLTQSLLAQQGVWMAMKGREPVDEMSGLPEDVEVFHVEHLAVPGVAVERCLVWMRRKQAPGTD
jgi:16S rRNA (guanine527-N7)-methyltransferase